MLEFEGGMLTRGRKRGRSAILKVRPALARFFNASNQLSIASYSGNEFVTLSTLSMVHPYVREESKLAWSQLLKEDGEGPHQCTVKDTCEILQSPLCPSSEKKKKKQCVPLKIKDQSEKEVTDKDGEEDKDIEALHTMATKSGIDAARLRSLLASAALPINLGGVASLKMSDFCKRCGVAALIPVINEEDYCAKCDIGGFWVCSECSSGNNSDELVPLNYCRNCFKYHHEECDDGCRKGFEWADHCHLCRECCRCRCPQCHSRFTDVNRVCSECGACTICHGNVL